MGLKNETDTLNETIILLKCKRANELILLKDQFHVTNESLKPINFIKRKLETVTSSPNFKNTLISNVVGLAAGTLTRKVLVGSSINPIKNLFGTILQFAVAALVSKHSDGLKSKGEDLIRGFLKQKKESDKEIYNNNNE